MKTETSSGQILNEHMEYLPLAMCPVMKDVGICFAFSNAKLVKFYFLVYRQHSDIDFNKKVEIFAYIRGKSGCLCSDLKIWK